MLRMVGGGVCARKDWLNDTARLRRRVVRCSLEVVIEVAGGVGVGVGVWFCVCV